MTENKSNNITEILYQFKNYIPFNLLKDTQAYHFRKTKKDSPNIIEKEMEKIFEEIKIKFPPRLNNAIFYLLGELADNIDQHSNFSFVSIIAHYDENKEEINIGVFDDGITIPGHSKQEQYSSRTIQTP